MKRHNSNPFFSVGGPLQDQDVHWNLRSHKNKIVLSILDTSIHPSIRPSVRCEWPSNRRPGFLNGYRCAVRCHPKSWWHCSLTRSDSVLLSIMMMMMMSPLPRLLVNEGWVHHYSSSVRRRSSVIRLESSQQMTKVWQYSSVRQNDRIGPMDGRVMGQQNKIDSCKTTITVSSYEGWLFSRVKMSPSTNERIHCSFVEWIAMKTIEDNEQASFRISHRENIFCFYDCGRNY